MFISKYLKNTLAACILAGVTTSAFAHEMGIQVYSLRNQFEANGVSDTFSTIQGWDLELLEAAGNLYGLSIYDYKNELIKHDLQVVSVDTNYEEVRDNPMAVAYKAAFYGAKFATFYWIPHEGEFGYEHTKEAVEVMNRAGKILAQNGVTLQYHPHGYELIPHEDGTLLDYMVQNVTEADFQMDVFWIKNGGGDPVEYLQKYPGRFRTLHLKDRLPGTENNTRGQQDVETNVVLGEGDVGIAAVVEEAKKQGIKYYFIEDESSRVERQVPKSIEYLKSLGVH
ncbi:sugar phosphate isomerase/epimerase family protein [Ningiella sp. W23]|uniref:sugar phosphate isomerase/epimerase family protein n=1 Tax=Ningiella sp. W23 TaxID=3023715 RepID=UPI003758207E